MKFTYYIALLCLVSSFSAQAQSRTNPFLVGVNVPIDYASVTAADLEEYASMTVQEVNAAVAAIKGRETVSFQHVFVAMDDILNQISKAYRNCHLFYWVSPDSLAREKGLAGFQALDSLSTVLYSDKALYDKMLLFRATAAYTQLKGYEQNLVDDMIFDLKSMGVNLSEADLSIFKAINTEINRLSSEYSTNMNAPAGVLSIKEKGAKGLPENFKSRYTAGKKYEIPIINATRETVMSNAACEKTRKDYEYMFNNRAADKNLPILDSLVSKRYALAQLMGYPSYAAYNLVPKMAKDPETAWKFIDDLVDKSKEKAIADIAVLEKEKNKAARSKGNTTLQTWDIAYYRNQVLKNNYQVDAEKVREYLPMELCLDGMFDIYQQVLGVQFRKVENPSVWHEDVEMYEVYEADTLKGRFYLDLYPRPNKETWFYGVQLSSGKATPQGYEVPVSMLLGNFTPPSPELPSLLSHYELETLFHEFGHIMNDMAYFGEFASQSDSKSDFGEAMSQLFENWIWDYATISSFARHYTTGEVLPKTTFDNMLKAKNITSGLSSFRSLRLCIYDMNLYDKYDPAKPVSTDKLWQDIDRELGVMPLYREGTHPQASWIHINTHPVYTYGYTWSEVYAQDMFTAFQKNGLTDQATGIRYRKLILANGTQRDIVEAVEEFLGRPSNNEAYIKSLGLE